jgi:hypothetical protein
MIRGMDAPLPLHPQLQREKESIFSLRREHAILEA